MSIYAGRDNGGRIVVDMDNPQVVITEGTPCTREPLSPAEAEKLAHELLALAYDHEANRAAYPPDADAAHDAAVDQALADEIDPDDPLQNDNHPENDASGEPDFGGNR